MSVWDSTVAIVILFVMTVLGVLTSASYNISNGPVTNILTDPTALHNYQYVMSIVPMMDVVYVAIYLGMLFAILIRSAFLDTSFIDYAVTWLASLVIVYISFWISNIFSAVFTSAALVGAVGPWSLAVNLIKDFPITQAVFLGVYSVVIGAGKGLLQYLPGQGMAQR